MWEKTVDEVLRKDRRSYRALNIRLEDRVKAFQSGQSPVIFAKAIPHRRDVVAPRVIVMPIPQTDAVKNDPKYQLNTGVGLICPTCGSTFIKPISKPGTGLGYLGSVSWIAMTSIIEAAVKTVQKQPYLCGYCDSMFTEPDDSTPDEYLPSQPSWQPGW